MNDSEDVQSYYTLAARGRAEIRRRRSQFIGTALPITAAGDVDTVMGELAGEFPRASHHAYAYRVGLKVPTVRYSDDGEPSGTAGMPLVQLLEGRELTDALVLVSRIFGGTLLGTGGLARAYADAGREALERAGVERRILHAVLVLHVPYALWGAVQYHVRTAVLRPLDVQYGAEVLLRLAVPAERSTAFAGWVAEMSSDSIELQEVDTLYAAEVE